VDVPLDRQLSLLPYAVRRLGLALAVARLTFAWTLLSRGGEPAALQPHHLLADTQQLELQLLRTFLPLTSASCLVRSSRRAYNRSFSASTERRDLLGDAEVRDVCNTERHADYQSQTIEARKVF
jgi:hypothetical protein